MSARNSFSKKFAVSAKKSFCARLLNQMRSFFIRAKDKLVVACPKRVLFGHRKLFKTARQISIEASRKSRKDISYGFFLFVLVLSILKVIIVH
jgi:hypothetical protein